MQAKNFIEQLCLPQSVESLFIFCISRSVKHLDPEKLNSNKIKLEAFFTNLYLKLQRNKDHFAQEGSNTKYNKFIYTVACLEEDIFVQIEPFVVKRKITIKDIHHFIEILSICFDNVDFIGIVKNVC